MAHDPFLPFGNCARGQPVKDGIVIGGRRSFSSITFRILKRSLGNMSGIRKNSFGIVPGLSVRQEKVDVITTIRTPIIA